MNTDVMKDRAYMTNGITAKVDVPAEYPKYRSQSEREWAVFGNMILYDELLERSAVQEYEPLIFNIPGGRYTPDFMHILYDGRVVFVEVKASKRQKNYRDARSKLRAAAAKNPWFRFVEAVGKGENWIVEVIK